jgi:hypothetical protein
MLNKDVKGLVHEAFDGFCVELPSEVSLQSFRGGTNL